MDESDMLLVASGDILAYNRIVGRWYPSVVRWLNNQRIRWEDAEEITQEVFLRLFTHARLFKPGSFRSWLWRIVRNAMVDRLRHDKYHNKTGSLEPELESDTKIEGVSRERNPEEMVETAELAGLARKALSEIDRDQADVLECYLEGYTFPEIAFMADECVPTIKSRSRLAREKLREALV